MAPTPAAIGESLGKPLPGKTLADLKAAGANRGELRRHMFHGKRHGLPKLRPRVTEYEAHLIEACPVRIPHRKRDARPTAG